jgi:RecB family exonuclease
VSLTIIAGVPGSGAEQRARERVGSAVTAGRSALLVAPSAKYATSVQADLAEAFPLGLRVSSIGSLVESQWSLRGDGRRIVSGLRRDVVLARALVSAGVSEHPGRGAVSLLGTLATRACAQGARPTSRVKGLSAMLLAALRAYLAELSDAGLVDEAEATRSLAACPPAAEVVGVEGLVSLSSDVEALLRGWAGAGCEVIVSLPWQRGCPATQPLDALVERLEGAGAGVEAVSDPDGRPAELARIAAGLFSGASPRPTDGRVLLGVARGEEAEADLIAERVSELTGAEGEIAEVAVAFADPARHAGWLRRAFEDAGIDAVWDVRVPVPETSLGRAMLRMWAFCTAGMEREDLAAFMRSPFSGVDTERADRADARWRGRRLTGPQLLGEADRARPLLASCSRIAGRPIDPATARDWKQLADDLLANAYGRHTPTPGMDGALDAAVHRAFFQALAEAADDGPRILASDLWAAFEASTVSPAAQGELDRVVVTSLDGLRGRTFGGVIIGGLTAGETPRQGGDDRLEGDAVLGALGALGIANDPEEHARAERLGFYLAATAATGSLTLVRSEADDDGRPLRASVFWEEFLDLYRSPGEDEAREGLPHLRVRVPDNEMPGGDGCRVARGGLANAVAIALLAGIRAVSPGEVELYTGCPYRWFVERRLRPKTAHLEVDAMAAGLAAHKALAAFYRQWTADGSHPRVTPECLEEAQSSARMAVSRVLAEAPEPSTLDEEWLLAAIEPAVLGSVERDATFLPDYTPAEFEWSFGTGEDDEPIDLGGVSIKGRADRIDVGPQGLIVIDYKRSRAKSYAEIEREGLVQLQLYALAASRRLGLPVAGGIYRSLARPADRGFVSETVAGPFAGNDVVDARTIDVLLERAVETARSAFEGMKAGAIGPIPDPQRCKYCLALAFCPEGVRS